MNDHFRPVGKPAPPRPRRPDALISLMMPSRPSLEDRLGVVPGAARTRAREAPVVQAVEVREDAVLVLQHHSRLVVLSSRTCRRPAAWAPPPRARWQPRPAASPSRRQRRLRPARRAAVGLVERRIGQRGRPADRRRELPVDLRARLRDTAGGELVEDAAEALRRQVLVEIVVDLHHRGVDAGAQALDLDPRKLAVAVSRATARRCGRGRPS